MDFSSKTSSNLCRALNCHGHGHNQTLRTRESTEKVNIMLVIMGVNMVLIMILP